MIRRILLVACLLFSAAKSEAQIQVDLKFKRLQYIAYEPVVATLSITNLAGRDIDLHNAQGQSWLGFEITGSEGQPIAPMSTESGQAPLKVEAGKRVTHQINLTPLYPVHDFGTYHVRTNVYFADLGKFFYSPTRVFEVTDARPIWQQTVGIPDGVAGTYSINDKSLEAFFPRETLQRMIRQPLEAVGYESRMDVIARMHGGGVSAQAGALRHGVSRALIEADPNLRGELKRRGFLTRDPRVKERKKAGLKKARKRPQFSKR